MAMNEINPASIVKLLITIGSALLLIGIAGIVWQYLRDL